MENEPSEIRDRAAQKMHPSVLGATGGSQVDNPQEDLEITVFSTCSIYCIKYILWKQLKVPIQNQVLSSENTNTLPNHIELRHAFRFESADVGVEGD